VAAQMLKAERRNIKKATTYFGKLIWKTLLSNCILFYRTEDKARAKT
jgi:hypothetical protein